MCRENRILLWVLLFVVLLFYSTACYVAIPRPPVRKKYTIDNNTIYLGRYVDYSIQDIERRFNEFKQCVIKKGAKYKLEGWTIYFVNDVFWWESVIGVTYPSRKVIYVMSFFEWSALEHELMHALGYLDGKHILSNEKLRECMKE